MVNKIIYNTVIWGIQCSNTSSISSMILSPQLFPISYPSPKALPLTGTQNNLLYIILLQKMAPGIIE